MRLSAPSAILAAVMLASGCGSSGTDSTPVACLGSVNAFLKALQAAPAAVRLDGTTPIGDCLPANQSTGDQTQVGQTLVRTATVLNTAALRDPGGRENVSLGYLVGAVQKATSGGVGIQAELVRRIQSAARFEGPARPPPAFDVAYAKGYAAGRSQG